MTVRLGPLLPVVVIDDSDTACPLGEALLAGGITQVEVTLRTPAALAAVRALSTVDGLTVGVGTVLTAADVDAAVDAGARFLVSPGWDAALLDRAIAHDISWVPGVATPSEVMTARAAGVSRVKLFPIAPLGGTSFVDALCAVFPDVTFVPSGGVAPNQVRDYLSRSAVEAVGASWVASRAAVAGRDFAAITEASRAAVGAIA